VNYTTDGKPMIEVIPMREEIKAPEENIPEITIAKAPEEKKELKKKINMKMYSRGAIREEIKVNDSAAVKIKQ
jgi:hypothetical protein